MQASLAGKHDHVPRSHMNGMNCSVSSAAPDPTICLILNARRRAHRMA
jgi:hypothetical protein